VGQHVLDGFAPGLVALVLLPVVAVDLPAFVGVVVHLAQAAALLPLREMEEELHHDLAVVGQPTLELVDVTVRLPPFLLAHRLVEPLAEHAVIPRAVEEGHEAVLGRRTW
jgi:hypothetical protein